MFKGIILIIDEFDNYGELIKSLIRNDKFKLIHSFSSSNLYSQQIGFSYLEEYKINKISSEEIFLKLNNNNHAFCVFKKRLYDIFDSKYTPFFLIPREYITDEMSRNDCYIKFEQFMKIFYIKRKNI